MALFLGGHAISIPGKGPFRCLVEAILLPDSLSRRAANAYVPRLWWWTAKTIAVGSPLDAGVWRIWPACVQQTLSNLPSSRISVRKWPGVLPVLHRAGLGRHDQSTR